MLDLSDRALWLLTSLLSAGVLVRIVYADLWWQPPYHSFTFLLATNLVRDILLWPISYDPRAYLTAWEVSLCALLVMHLWAGWSAYEFMHQRDTREFIAVLTAAAALCCLPLLFESENIFGVEAVYRGMLLLYRFVDLGLCVLVLGGMVGKRNVPAHAWLLASYFGAYGVVCLIKNLLPLQAVQVDRFHFALIAALYAAWLKVPLAVSHRTPARSSGTARPVAPAAASR